MALDRFLDRGFEVGCLLVVKRRGRVSYVFMTVGTLPGRCFVHLRTYFPITSLSDESNMM